MSKEILIIIPAYNEEHTIGKVLSELTSPPISDMADVLVMNDHSSDKTEEVVRSYGVNIVTHIYNFGYGSGLQVGYKYAVNHGYKYVMQMDADGQHDVCNIKDIYEVLTTPDKDGKCPDIVLGSRFIKNNGKYPDYPTSGVKKLAYAIFRTLIKFFTGQKITDPTTGLQGLNYRAFSYYAGFKHFDDKYPDANMITQMLLMGYKVCEIPALMHLRTEGTSMHSGIIKPMVYMFRMTFSIIAAVLRVKLYKVDIK